MQEELVEQNELYEHYRFNVDKGQGSMRIDKYLFNRLENTSRNKIQNAARAGNILVNEKPARPSYSIKPGDVISIVLPHPPHEFEIIPEDLPVDIIYEDNSILIVNKAPGMVVHPGHGNYTGTLVNALTWYLKDLPSYEAGDIRPGLVHRIDKDTSGILVIAKTEIALNKLAKQFFNHTVDRTYNAIVWGDMDKDEDVITGHIGRSGNDRMKMQVYPEGEYGKHAVTHYRVLERLGYVNLIECKLETGRTHQIRVHMEYIRHPLFNDERYGGNRILKGTTFTKYKQFVMNCFKILPRHALHAKSLGFEHPETGKQVYFDSGLPDDMMNVIDKWKNYIAGRE